MIKKVTAKPAEKPLVEKIISYGPLLPCIAVATLVLTGLSGYQAPATAVGGAVNPAVSASADAANAVSETAATTVPRGTITRTNPPRTTAAAASGAKKSLGTVKEAGAYKDGTYTGTATGFVGPITVKVTVSGGKIASIAVTNTSDNEPYLSNAKAVIDKIIGGQTTNVDVVSGATYSSNGIIGAVRNALSKAAVSDSAKQAVAAATTTKATTTTTRKPVTTGKAGQFPYPDGTYEGEGEGRNDIIRLAVTLKDGSIAAINILEHYEDEVPYFNNAKALLDDVLKAQSLKVDTVSGATLSSNGLLEALGDALAKAEAASRGVTTTTTAPTTTTTTAAATDPTSESTSTTDATSSAQPANDQPENEPSEPAVPESRYADGDYYVSVTCYPDGDEDFDPYTLTVKVTISGDRITDVSDVSGDGGSSNDSYIRKAVNGTSKKEGVVSQITSRGDPSGVDAVSGATCTSDAIVAACEQALSQAAEAQR